MGLFGVPRGGLARRGNLARTGFCDNGGGGGAASDYGPVLQPLPQAQEPVQSCALRVPAATVQSVVQSPLPHTNEAPSHAPLPWQRRSHTRPSWQVIEASLHAPSPSQSTRQGMSFGHVSVICAHSPLAAHRMMQSEPRQPPVHAAGQGCTGGGFTLHAATIGWVTQLIPIATAPAWH